MNNPRETRPEPSADTLPDRIVNRDAGIDSTPVIEAAADSGADAWLVLDAETGSDHNADMTPGLTANACHTRTPAETLSSDDALMQASVNLATLLAHRTALYTMGESTSVSKLEAHELLSSTCFVLGIGSPLNEETARRLANGNLQAAFDEGVARVSEKVDNTMRLWQEVCTQMPPVKNIALRDTLTSIGGFKRHYDIQFAAHEIPCAIDYPLYQPVSEALQGVDYVYEWLSHALEEARYLQQFELDELTCALKASYPDYRGLIINLCEAAEAWSGIRFKTAER